MTILLAGGNDALRRSIAVACVRAGHRVRVLAVGTNEAGPTWPAGVEPIGAGGDPMRWHDTPRGCDAVVVVDPDLTPSAHTRDSRAAVEETLEGVGRHGVPRLVLVTSVRARRAAQSELPMRSAHGNAIDWLDLRVAPVYGIGDDPVTLFAIMMRSLPAVPVLGGRRVMRPLWHEDLAAAIAMGLALPAEALNRTRTLVGPDAVTQDELYRHVAALIDRRPSRIPVPDFLAAYGERLAEALRMPAPHAAAFLAFGDGSGGGMEEAAAQPLPGLARTPLDQGLRRLLEQLAEVTPGEGVGSLELKTFSTLIRGSAYDAASLLALFRARFADVMPVAVGVEPAVPDRTLTEGAVLTIALPGRGHVAVRVEDVQATKVTIATLRGHAVAGIVRFSTQPVESGIRFEVMTCDRAANPADWISLTLGGSRAQDANWTAVVRNVAALAGVQSGDVETEVRRLSAKEAATVEQRIVELLREKRAAASMGNTLQ